MSLKMTESELAKALITPERGLWFNKSHTPEKYLHLSSILTKNIKHAALPGAPFSSHPFNELQLQGQLTLWSPRFCSAALRYGARFPRGAFPRQSAVKTRLFRNEPRLRSVVNPSHRLLAPREPGCWGVSQSLAFPPSRYSFIKAEPDAVPNRPQRRTGQPSRRRSSRVR